MVNKVYLRYSDKKVLMAPVTLYVDEELFIGKRFIMRAPSSRIPNKLLVRVVEEHNGGYIVERITREEQINEILI